MFLIFFIIIQVLKAENLVEYRLGLNFGTVFYDFSESGRHGQAQNGSPVASTDRGLYFKGANHGVDVPIFELPDLMKTVFWIMTDSESGQVFNFGNSNESLRIRFIPEEVAIKTSIAYQQSGENCMAKGKWALIILKRNVQEYTLSSSLCSTELVLTFNGQFSFILIGGQPSIKAFTGFLWYFLMTTDPVVKTDFINVSPTNFNKIGSANFCSTTFKDKDYGEVCISTELDKNKDAYSNDCGNNKYCSGSFIFNCTCQSYCLHYFNDSTSSCIDTSCSNDLTIREYKCCKPQCSSCINTSSCTACIDPNSILISGICYCKTGYYGTPSNSLTTDCKTCPSLCLTCTSNDTCTSCQTRLILSNGVCGCQAGYYVKQELNGSFSCESCSPDCSLCNESVCIQCFDSNAEVIDGVCECKKSYYGAPFIDIGDMGCLKCPLNCKNCISDQTCIECYDINSFVKDGKCVCKDSYYGDPSSSSSNAGCQRCNSICNQCSEFDHCTSCKDENSFLSNGECKCNQGFYIDASSQTPICEPCPPQCQSCLNSSTCLTCKSLNSNLNSASQCECIPGYYNLSDLTSLNSCHKCNNSCLTCKNSESCLSCAGNNTILVSGSCNCNTNFYQISSNDANCVKCPESSEIPECNISCPLGSTLIEGECIECGPLCYSCNSNLYCSKCKSNSEVINGKCTCLLGYKLKQNECKSSFFYVNISDVNENFILIEFSELIQGVLKNSNLTLEIRNQVVNIDIKQTDYKFVKVSLKDYFYFDKSENFYLRLKEKIYSQTGSALKNYLLEGKFPSFNSTMFTSKIQTSIQVAVASSFVSSACTNPAAFWVFINTIQIIMYMPLANLDFSRRLLEFIRALRGFSLIPNYFEYFFNSSLSPAPNRRQRNTGISSTVFWVNIGPNTLILVFYVGMFPVLFIGSRVRKLSDLCKNLMGNYKFSIFIRFWVESYLELGIFSFIQTGQAGLNNFQRIFNLVSSIIIAVIIIQSLFAAIPIILISFLIRNRNRLTTPDTIRKYGSLYDEFKVQHGVAGCFFYPIFVIRRVQYALTQLYLSSIPNLQLVTNLVFSFFQLSYTLYYKPFKERLVFVSQIIGDVCVLVLFCISGFYLSDIEDKTNWIVDTVFIAITVFCVGIQSLISLYISMRIIVTKCRVFIKRRDKEKTLVSNKVFPAVQNSPEESKIDIEEIVKLSQVSQ